MLNNKLFLILMTFFGSFIGQLIIRITTLDGSLDKWWLMLPPLTAPPLSLIPTYFILDKKVKRGEGGLPYDLYMLIPAIAAVVSSLYLENGLKQTGYLASVIKFLIIFSTMGLSLYYRDKDICINKIIHRAPEFNNKTSLLNPLVYLVKSKIENFKETKEISYSKIIVQSAMVTAFIPLLPHLTKYIPFLGSSMSTLGGISPSLGLILEVIVKMLGIMLVYVLVNMLNGRNINKSCKKKFKTKTVVIVLIVSLITYIIIESGRVPLFPLDL